MRLAALTTRGTPWVLAVCLLLPAWARAELLPAGDLRLRHELQMLADAGLIRAPIQGWPLTLADLELAGDTQDPGLARIAERLSERDPGSGIGWGFSVGGMDEPSRLRGFEDLPRDETEVGAELTWHTNRVAMALRLSRVDDPLDGKERRLDGSYIGASFGNWFLAAAAVDRWWGPGWDGSLILSNNARPVPALTLQRRRSNAPQVRGFRWVGPWTTQFLMGKLESDRDHADARLFGWRFGFRPLPKLEIGLTRSAQWCGAGRPCDFDTFVDLLSGLKDNPGDNVERQDEPGNQLAGIDLRYAFTVLGRPWAVYAQRIGEDERGGRPSAWLTLGGFETWSQLGSGGGSYRLHLEYSDTACGQHNFGCAYNHHVYTDGYRYRNRPIGHSMDGDGRMVSAGGVLITSAGHSWHALARRAETNRGNDVRNSFSPRKQDLASLELTHTRYYDSSTLTLGLIRDDGEFSDDGGDVQETRVFAEWHWSLGNGRR